MGENGDDIHESGSAWHDDRPMPRDHKFIQRARATHIVAKGQRFQLQFGKAIDSTIAVGYSVVGLISDAIRCTQRGTWPLHVSRSLGSSDACATQRITNSIAGSVRKFPTGCLSLAWIVMCAVLVSSLGPAFRAIVS